MQASQMLIMVYFCNSNANIVSNLVFTHHFSLAAGGILQRMLSTSESSLGKFAADERKALSGKQLLQITSL